MFAVSDLAHEMLCVVEDSAGADLQDVVRQVFLETIWKAGELEGDPAAVIRDSGDLRAKGHGDSSEGRICGSQGAYLHWIVCVPLCLIVRGF